MKPETAVRSMVMRALASRWRRALLRTGGRLRRRLQGGAPNVYYFHQADDPYSHLAAQALPRLQERYRVRFAPHLAPEQGAAFAGDAERYPRWALADAADVAPFYGLSFPDNAALPSADAVLAANQALAQQAASEGFAEAAVKAGDALWRGAVQAGEGASAEAARSALRQGGELRRRLGHYRGGMFHFEGEWYWGVDRLCRLGCCKLSKPRAPPQIRGLPGPFMRAAPLCAHRRRNPPWQAPRRRTRGLCGRSPWSSTSPCAALIRRSAFAARWIWRPALEPTWRLSQCCR